MVHQVMVLNFKRQIAEAEKVFQTTLTIFYKEHIQKRRQEIKLHYKDCR